MTSEEREISPGRWIAVVVEEGTAQVLYRSRDAYPSQAEAKKLSDRLMEATR